MNLSAQKIISEHLSADKYIECCDQVWSTDKRANRVVSRKKPDHKAIVYAKRDHVEAFFPSIRRSRSKIVLVTAESDKEVNPGECIPLQVGEWFSTNSYHSKIHSLPLGLGNSYCQLTVKAPDLAAVFGAPKERLLYLNFRLGSNESARKPIWDSYESGEKAGWVTRRPGDIAGLEYARQLASHVFVLCPPGNGTDTHRLWEALYAGSIPIVKQDPKLESFVDLPILFVDHLEGLSHDYLRGKAQEMANRKDWNIDKLFLPYWQSEFKDARKRMKKKISLSLLIKREIKKVIILHEK